jgi:hypothetical protein
MEVTVPVPFGYGDGSVQGAWGVGQLLFDMANQVEIARNEAMDAQCAQGKLKLMVQEGKNINDVKLTVNDEMMTVEGAQFAQPGAATPANDKGFKLLDDEFTMWAEQVVGNFIPPIPLQPSDTKAAAINQAQQAEGEVQNNNLQNFLKHVAYIIKGITSRVCDPENPDEDVSDFRQALMDEDHLTEEEIDKLSDQPVIQTIAEFTPTYAMARAQFAASRNQNPNTASLYDPRKLEEIQAQAIPGGKAVLDYAIVPAQDQTIAAEAQRQQIMENTTLAFGQDVPVLAHDNDPVHLATIKGPLEQAISGGKIEAASSGLRHAAGHYTAAVAKKSLGGNGDNEWKSWLAQMEKQLNMTQQVIAQEQLRQAQMQSAAGGAPAGGSPPGVDTGAPGMPAQVSPSQVPAIGSRPNQPVFVHVHVPEKRKGKVKRSIKFNRDFSTGRVTDATITHEETDEPAQQGQP